MNNNDIEFVLLSDTEDEDDKAELIFIRDEEEDNNWMFVEDEFTENEDLDESFRTK